MKKWTKLITLSSVAVLASASPLTAFADENAPVTSDVPAVVTTPEVPTDTSSAPSDDTVVPTVPETPTEAPSTPEDNTVVPTDPNVTVPSTSEPAETTPSTEVTPPSTEETSLPSTEDNSASEPSSTEAPDQDADTTTEPKTSEPAENTVTVPTIDGGSTTLTPDVTVPTNNPAVSAQTAINAGASQVGTTSTVTGQVVSNVTPSAPVYTNTGYQIVSTQNGQVVLSDGSTVAPEAIGAVTNTDKTITVTKADGTKATLPETGEAANFLAVVGTGLLGLVGFLFKKKLV
ncbi:Extracellular protein [Streptococcus thermophilus]|uniref:LPXTG cell wall anchor domain-containing protein n=1 Tax=Streptococcus thermophilus TaxID=1308 RepID=UPI0015C1E07E|nr:LPXTG cell wall anchor domain-containing protein [Streptococcus thermophilus]CAD0146701.1 Extracellular protein [Streptococcus thermophilus]